MTEAPTTGTTPTEPTRMVSPTAMLRSLNGYEEQAIEDHFGRDQEELGYGRQLRALVFIHRVRSGAQPGPAFLEAMGMTVQDVFNHFDNTAAPDEGDEAPDPESPAGDEDHGTLTVAIGEQGTADQVDHGARAALDLCTGSEGCASPVHLSTCPEI